VQQEEAKVAQEKLNPSPRKPALLPGGSVIVDGVTYQLVPVPPATSTSAPQKPTTEVKTISKVTPTKPIGVAAQAKTPEQPPQSIPPQKHWWGQRLGHFKFIWFIKKI
jgi:hypothetical protein